MGGMAEGKVDGAEIRDERGALEDERQVDRLVYRVCEGARGAVVVGWGGGGSEIA